MNRSMLATIVGLLAGACSQSEPPQRVETPRLRVNAAIPTLTAKVPRPAPASAEPVDEPPPKKTPDVVYVPTPQPVVDRMLELAEVKNTDLVYDLGCGDGRIVVTAAKRYGTRAVGFDIDPDRVAEARKNVRDSGVGHLVRIEQKDIFTLDLRPANVLTLYLLPELNVRLVPQIKKMKHGSRIVSHDFDMAGFKHVTHVTLQPPGTDRDHEIFLWRTPLVRDATQARAP